MNRVDLKNIAETLNADLKTLKAQRLYISAFFYSASSSNPTKLPDRIVVEGIKNLNTTGKFTSNDRAAVNHIINRHCGDLNVRLLTNDWGMHNAVITLK